MQLSQWRAVAGEQWRGLPQGAQCTQGRHPHLMVPPGVSAGELCAPVRRSGCTCPLLFVSIAYCRDLFIFIYYYAVADQCILHAAWLHAVFIISYQ